jgi:hypothetical protein
MKNEPVSIKTLLNPLNVAIDQNAPRQAARAEPRLVASKTRNPCKREQMIGIAEATHDKNRHRSQKFGCHCSEMRLRRSNPADDTIGGEQ